MHLKTLLMICLLFTFISPGIAEAEDIDNTFTYQGALEYQGSPANGVFDFQFRIYSAEALGSYIAGVTQVEDVLVENGVFTTEITPNWNVFDEGIQRWLEISVREGSSTDSMTTLAPRQKITGSPFALPDGRLKYYSISALTLNSPKFVRHVGFGEAYLASGSPQAWATAPVHLPVGARIQSLACDIQDNDSNGRLEISLQRHKGDGVASVTSLVMIDTTLDFASPTKFKAHGGPEMTEDQRLVVNKDTSYYLSVMLKGIQSPALAVYQCVIKYL